MWKNDMLYLSYTQVTSLIWIHWTMLRLQRNIVHQQSSDYVGNHDFIYACGITISAYGYCIKYNMSIMHYKLIVRPSFASDVTGQKVMRYVHQCLEFNKIVYADNCTYSSMNAASFSFITAARFPPSASQTAWPAFLEYRSYTLRRYFSPLLFCTYSFGHINPATFEMHLIHIF